MFPLVVRFLHVTSVRYALPVDTLTVRSPAQFTAAAVTLPVETERARVAAGEGRALLARWVQALWWRARRPWWLRPPQYR